MKFADFFRLGLTNLKRRKFRTFMTAIAMMVGIMAIVVSMSIGIGYNELNKEKIESLGSLTVIDVKPARAKTSKMPLLNDKALESIEKLSSVEAVTPVIQAVPYIMKKKYAQPIRLFGIDIKKARYFGIEPNMGELPDKGTKLRPSLILTDDVQNNFADLEDWRVVEDKEIIAKLNPLRGDTRLTFDYAVMYSPYREDDDGRIIPSGMIYKTKISGICDNQKNRFATSGFMDYKRLMQILEANEEYSTSVNEESDNEPFQYPLLWIKVNKVEEVENVTRMIESAGFETMSLNEILEAEKKQALQIQGMLIAIGAVSLLVAGIGTANTMMMAINERRKEIGILKVIGTRLSDIRKMFLTEAAMIGVIGGIGGMVLSYIMKLILPSLLKNMEIRSVIPIWLSVGAVIFSVIVAILSALGPAVKAMGIEPQTAIRSE